MAALRERDYLTMLACVAQLQECGDLEQFPRAALTEIPKLVGADHITFNYVAPSVPKVVVLGMPDLTGNYHAERERVFARHLGDQPILRHYLATGDPSPHKFSDFLSVREYHRLPLYRHLYHDLRYEDQLAFMLFPPGAEMIAIALARDRRNFTERDRDVLSLLRPHVAAAFRQLQRLDLLRRALHERENTGIGTRVTTVALDRRNRPVHFSNQARQWMRHFFPDRSRDFAGLPAAVKEWLARERHPHQANASPPRPGTALTRERNGQRLRVNFFPGLRREGLTLVLELETAPVTAHATLSGKLTRREITVLLQVEQGKTNEETAATLGISPLTVRTHLEHIFQKLHVPSRTAAVTRFRKLCGSPFDAAHTPNQEDC